MSTLYSPKVPTDGLIMSLDAANPKSFLSRVEVLVVAGGGGGGMDMGGGGGGGGVVYSQSYQLSTISSGITVTVGNGGTGAPAAGTNGQPGGHQYTVSATGGGNSVFDTITANGGGYGASSYWGYLPNYGQAQSGGCGGGASGYSDGTGNGGAAGAGGRYGTGTVGQGYRGGGGTGQYYSGGGGGAGGIGGEGAFNNAPFGGPGLRCDILGIPLYWGGGGGGAGYSVYGGVGGIGGGGGGAVISNAGGAGYNNGGTGGAGGTGQWANVPGGDGGTNTGGGGGGGSHYNSNNKGGEGGSGIVVVKYPGAPKATGGTIIQFSNYTIHVFLSSGTFTPNVWKDTVGDYDAGFYGTPSWSPVNGGVFVTTSGGGRAAASSLVLSGAGTHTIIGASRYITGSGGRMISSLNNNWLLGQWSNYVDPFYSEGWVNYASIGNDQMWRIYAETGDTVNDIWSFYINGRLVISNNGGSQGPNGLQIGGYGGLNELTDGHCGFVMAYNRVLTAAEIYQVFDAHRGRFGL